MNKTILSAAFIPAAIAVASCSSAQTGDSAPTPSAGPVAGEAVTLAGDVPFNVASYGQFDEPWAIAVEPGTGNLFITEKGGTAKFFQPANGRVGTVTGLPEVAYGGQGGLGDIAFGPDYAETGTIYLSWAQDAGAEGRRAVVGRGQLVCEEDDSCSIEGLNVIWRQEPAIDSPGHFSHKMEFSPDGQYLFVSSGDRMQQDPAQDLSNNLGTVVRLNLDGTPAPGNPFADRGSPTDQIWSYGQRNMLGLEFDSDGELWALEHGPRGGDELNLVEPGNNYGWPERSSGVNYNGDPIPDHSADDGFVKPAIGWTPVIAPGDFIFYDGGMFDAWQGDAVIANLGTQSLVVVDTDASANSATEEARYDFGNRLRDIVEYPDGSIWIIEDGEGGRLLRLTSAE